MDAKADCQAAATTLERPGASTAPYAPDDTAPLAAAARATAAVVL